ncbi:MAG: uroporphyrinogen-III C-methyltransferase [Chloroflexi bacterium]|nr:uroporphyrinogen-III C-methyltransferase [Chloroflexota bacterium]
MSQPGRVYIVGAGPGDPGLITVKGLDCLRRADVVVYDRLIDKRLLDQAKPGSQLSYVGKESSKHTVPQEKINALLVAAAQEGKTVVRLKGGDPFVFGRGGEEAEALAAERIPFEIVPGVTSAVAVPAYAGIPITHRDYNSQITVITGREDPGKARSSIDWGGVAASAGTLVFLMGMHNLASIVEQLVQGGRAPETPVALTRWGTFLSQETLVGTLADIVERVKQTAFLPPAVIVVGEVVGLRDKLRWFDNRPLFGKHVLVTRSREQAGALSELLEAYGAQPVELPAVQIEPPSDVARVDRVIEVLDSYDWVIFTSANGVKWFIDRLYERGLDARAFRAARVGAIGPATAARLGRYGIRPDFVPEEYVAEAVAAGLKWLGVEGRRILLPRAEVAREVLVVELRRAGATVDDVAVYRTVAGKGLDPSVERMLLEGKLDVVTFTSSSTVKNLLAALDEAGDAGSASAIDLLEGAAVACIGPITAMTAKEMGLKVDIVAREYTVKGLVEAIEEYYRAG